MSGISHGQKTELHRAMLAYLRGAGFQESARAFAAEAKIGDDGHQHNGGGGAGEGAVPDAMTLERRWTSVVRLQKKVVELEALLEELRSDTRDRMTSAAGKQVHPHGRNVAGRKPLLVPQGDAAHTLKGHRSRVNSVAFHPVYTLLASASDDASIKLWDYESGELERTLKGHLAAVTSVAFSGSGRLLASGSADASIKLWEVAADSCSCRRTLQGHSEAVSSVAFSRAGDVVVSTSRDTSVRLWDAETGAQLHALLGHTDWVRCAALSSDGALLATGGSDKTAHVWDVRPGAGAETGPVAVLQGHEMAVECVAFSLRDDPPTSAPPATTSSTLGRPARGGVGGAVPENATRGEERPNGTLRNPPGGSAGAAASDSSKGSPLRPPALARASSADVADVMSPTARVAALAYSQGAFDVFDQIVSSRREQGGESPLAWLVTGARDGALRVWDTLTWTCVVTLVSAADIRFLPRHHLGGHE
eukprot:jgi/Mesvir1/4023/Mv05820-RA.3